MGMGEGMVADQAQDLLSNQSRLALNRFGLGRALDEPLPADPRGWLMAQLRTTPIPDVVASLPKSGDLVTGMSEARKQARGAGDAQKRFDILAEQRRLGRQHYGRAVQARISAALQTQTPFAEHLVHFWANHFCVSADNPPMVALAGTLEAEAIRPHVMGRFEDMLMAVESHPSMLVYLNQVTSVGPESSVATMASTRNPNRVLGLNENLAREIMELHTLGVRSGYTQADVTEFARALTGWSLGGAEARRGYFEGGFEFRPQAHQPGTRTILGKRYEQSGEAQARAVLHDLAHSPATAKFIAGKLARHFAGEKASSALSDRLARAFTESAGDLPTVYRALIDSPEVWQQDGLRIKTPWEWTISALRGFGVREAEPRMQLPQQLIQLGQQVWKPGSPAGWPDNNAAWAAPDALVRRVEEANRFVTQLGDRLEPRATMTQLLGEEPSKATRFVIEGADSQRTALALVLVSPEFLRR